MCFTCNDSYTCTTYMPCQMGFVQHIQFHKDFKTSAPHIQYFWLYAFCETRKSYIPSLVEICLFGISINIMCLINTLSEPILLNCIIYTCTFIWPPWVFISYSPTPHNLTDSFVISDNVLLNMIEQNFHCTVCAEFSQEPLFLVL